MIGRSAFTTEILAEVGWMTLMYSFLEENLTIFTAALEDPEDPQGRYNEVAGEGLKKKLSRFRAAVIACCKEYGVASGDFETAIVQVQNAAERRNEVVHGFVSFAADQETLRAKRVHKTTPAHPLTVEEVAATNRALFEAEYALELIAIPVWNSVVGVRKSRAETVPEPER